MLTSCVALLGCTMVPGCLRNLSKSKSHWGMNASHACMHMANQFVVHWTNTCCYFAYCINWFVNRRPVIRRYSYILGIAFY